ncbi:MAG: helix-turn-helix domain-containing protein [Burkholderiaceae bacterium]
MDHFTGAVVVASARYRLRVLTVRDSLLVAVLRGTKTLVGAQRTLTAAAGQTMLVAAGTEWDVVNDPAGQSRYEALVLPFSGPLVEEATAHFPGGQNTEVNSAAVLTADDELLNAVRRTVPLPGQPLPTDRLMHHRCLEVLLLLGERGHRFAAPGALGWEARIRRLVAQRPHAQWTVDSLAGSFHMSASTLRRRLAESGATLAAIVREVRLEIALGLLQTTELPIGDIAQRCGWQSHSRFTATFQARWGVAPSVVKARTQLETN